MKTYKTGSNKCPRCGANLHWSCVGKSGWAHCSKSPSASRVVFDLESIEPFCHYKCKCVRLDNGEVMFIHKEDE